MKKWEYTTVRASSVGREGAEFRHSHFEYVTEEALDEMGEEGWEAVSATSDTEGVLFVLLKREKSDG